MITLWLASLTASAQSLAWAWPPDTVRTWHLETVVGYSNPIWLRAEHNIEGRAERVHSEQIWTCSAGEPSRTGWELSCTVDDVRLVALPHPGESTEVRAVLGELDTVLTGATVQLQLQPNGHVRGVDLEGLDKDGRRSNAIHETLRLLVARSAAGFDLHTPVNGDLKQTWKQKDDLLYSYPISTGSLSGARITHTLGDHDQRHVSVTTTGTGSVRVGEATPAPSRTPGQDEPWMLDLQSQAQALFDGERGCLVNRRWVVIGEPMASSGWKTGQGVQTYVQTGVITQLAPGAPVAPLGPSGLWTVDFQPGPAWQQLLANPQWQATEKP